MNVSKQKLFLIKIHFIQNRFNQFYQNQFFHRTSKHKTQAMCVLEKYQNSVEKSVN